MSCEDQRALKIIPFRPEHLDALELQPAQMLTAAPDPARLGFGPAFSGFVGGGVVACAGLVPQGGGRAFCWALLSACGPAVFRQVRRAVKRGLDAYDFRRLEMTVDHDFENGRRWARTLGFRLETPDGMAAWSPDGRTFDLYARVRNHCAVPGNRLACRDEATQGSTT